jgi:aryl-alcohol dehydrogenase-like predicted oxidoreductase
MVKIGMDSRSFPWKMRGSAADLAADVDFALAALGTEYIDIIVLTRVPEDVPIEESILGLKAIVASGKARHIGLSEASASVIRSAHALFPVYCIEQEWSLWSRDIEQEIVPTCRELGIKIVAYSPLGRGFLTGAIADRAELAGKVLYHVMMSRKHHLNSRKTRTPTTTGSKGSPGSKRRTWRPIGSC